MKKIWLCMITILAVVSLSACSTSPTKDNSSSDTNLLKNQFHYNQNQNLSVKVTLFQSQKV